MSEEIAELQERLAKDLKVAGVIEAAFARGRWAAAVDAEAVEVDPRATTLSLQQARHPLLAWLAGNGILGAQFSWVLRPFFGSPNLNVAFLRPYPMKGNFYESVWHSIDKLSGGHANISIVFLLVIVSVLAIPVIAALKSAITAYYKPTT